MLYIGVDLGTSAVKLLLMDERGTIHRVVSKEYPLFFPQPGWSEQRPEDWYEQTMAGLKELLADCDRSKVEGISFGGQMHGLVILDKDDRVIRPAILWNDGRTGEETDYLNQVIGKEKLSEYTGNIAFAGFTAPKILWVKKHEPEHFAAISKIMLAKVYESYEVVGTLLPQVAQQLELPENVKVIAGAGDNAAAAVGTGTVGEGKCNISLGTSGTIFISSEHFCVDENNALHAFAHADGKWHLMGCMLSAASCNKWWMDDILGTSDYGAEQAAIRDLGENRVFFLPYLMGERSPHNNPNARGTFIGMTMDTARADMTQAVLEGVAFALRDSFEVAKSLGLRIEKTRICGGGAKSPLWRKIMANVLNIPVEQIESEEGPGLGGAILAAVGCGAFASVEEAAEKLVRPAGVEMPDASLAAKYEARYQQFRQIYPACRQLFDELVF